MKKILFASDIDNTLLYSYKKKENGFICIEINKGREQGFMTRKTYSAFSELVSVAELLPVTTRSIEQYLRIKWPNGFVPEYALAANGAVLLHNNRAEQSRHIGETEDNELKNIYRLYRKDERFINCRIVDGAYMFVYCADKTDPVLTRNELAENCSLRVEASGKKIYFFPDGLTKGSALTAFCQGADYDITIAAGDSIMDLSLLNAADIALIPDGFRYVDRLRTRYMQAPEGFFSDFVVETVIKMAKESVYSKRTK